MINPAFMDIFGTLGFIVLLALGISLLKVAKKRAVLLMVISALGLAVDLYIVTTTFLLP